MLISHKYKFAWYHIPKTSGTWMRDILFTIDPDIQEFKRILSKPGDPNHPVYCWHVSLRYLQKDPLYEKIKSYKFFAVIRNPIDRHVSAYNMIMKDSHYVYYNKDEKGWSFYEYVAHMNRYDISQINWLKDVNGVVPPNIKIIIYENQMNELKEWFNLLGIGEEHDLEKILNRPPLNVSTKTIVKSQLNYDKLKKHILLEEMLFYLWCV